MKWSELDLPDRAVAHLRPLFGDDGADQVVRLAHGAPDLLARTIGEPEVEGLQTRYPAPPPKRFDYLKAKLGARFPAPAGQPDLSAGFTDLRDSLVDAVKRASTPSDKAAAEHKLVELYQNGSIASAG